MADGHREEPRPRPASQATDARAKARRARAGGGRNAVAPCVPKLREVLAGPKAGEVARKVGAAGDGRIRTVFAPVGEGKLRAIPLEETSGTEASVREGEAARKLTEWLGRAATQPWRPIGRPPAAPSGASHPQPRPGARERFRGKLLGATLARRLDGVAEDGSRPAARRYVSELLDELVGVLGPVGSRRARGRLG
jgi:hypothetical protein